MKKVDLNHVALKMNSLTKQIDEEEIYFAGRYFVGFVNNFVLYETTW